jgi:hypothetical protein
MSRQASDQLYIELGYFTPEEYYVYTAEAVLESGYYIDPDYIEYDYYEDRAGNAFATLACDLTEVQGTLQEAEAALSSTASVTALVGVVKEASASVSAAFSTTATISHIEGADLFAFSEAQLALAVARLRDYSASLNAVFDIATDYIRIKQLSADAAAAFTQSTDVSRSRGVDSNIQAAFSLSATANANTKEASATITSTASVTATFTGVTNLVRTRLESAFGIAATLSPVNPGRPLTQSANTLSVGAGDYDASIKKFGTHSAKIDGDNGVVYAIPNNSSFDNDYLAIEFWIYSNPTNVPLLQAKDSGGTSRYLAVTGPSSADVRFTVGSTNLITSVTLTADVWNHVLILTRVGSNQTAIYLNGTRRAQATTNTGFSLNNGSFAIGDWQAGSLARVDEFRVMKGTSSWPLGWNPSSTTITVPTEPFVNLPKTSLLVHFDATADDDVSEFIPNQALLSVDTRLEAVAGVTKNVSSNISSQAAVSAIATAIIDNSITLTATASVIAAGGFTIEASASIDSALTFAVNAGALNPGEMEATAIATVVAAGDRFRSAQSDLNVVSTQVAQADRLQGIIETFTATATLTANVDKFKGIIQNLSSSSTLTATANFKHLQLINGGTITAVNANDTNTWLTTLATVNMWLRLSRNLNNNETITLWRANARGFISNPDYTTNLKLTKLSSGAYRFTATRYMQADVNEWFSSSIAFTSVATNIDFTQWHNLTMPLIGNEGYGAASFDGVPAINGAVFTSTGGTSTILNGTVETSYNPGTWGDSSKTDLSIYINKLWIKQTGFPNVIRDTDFYNNATNWEVAYGTNGQVTSTEVMPNEPGFDEDNNLITPEVFHNWNQGIFETGNNVAPAWNYTKVGTVLTGYTFDFSASASAQSTIFIDAQNIVNADANINVVAAQSTINARLREPGVALASAFALTVINDRFRSPGARTLSSAFTQSTNAVKTARTASNQSSAFTQTASERRVRFADSALSASANLALPFGKILKTPGNTLVTSEFSQTTVNARFRDNEIDTDSIATQLSAVAKIGDFLITLESASQLSAEAFKQTDVVSNLIVEATCSADPIKTVFGEAAIASQFNVAVIADKIKRVEADLNTQFTVAIPGQKVTDTSSGLVSTFTTVSTPNRIRDNAVGLNTTTALAVPITEIVIFFNAALQAQATGLFIITKLVVAQANLQANGFQLTAGRVIHIDEYYTLIVPQENRIIKVQSEDRTIIIDQETRKLTV